MIHLKHHGVIGRGQQFPVLFLQIQVPGLLVGGDHIGLSVGYKRGLCLIIGHLENLAVLHIVIGLLLQA